MSWDLDFDSTGERPYTSFTMRSNHVEVLIIDTEVGVVSSRLSEDEVRRLMQTLDLWMEGN